jgi:Na+-translocating ferredoxin:NAD+ oxidoreductase RnfG subunit
LPSILSSHVYTLVGLAAVGTLLIATINSFTTTLKAWSENEQLKNLLSQVAAKAEELLATVAATNASAQIFLQMPASIGYKQYWLQARNDSTSAWIEGALGPWTEHGATHRVYLPHGTSASGHYLGGYGPAVLESYRNGTVLQLKLSSFGG